MTGMDAVFAQKAAKLCILKRVIGQREKLSHLSQCDLFKLYQDVVQDGCSHKTIFRNNKLLLTAKEEAHPLLHNILFKSFENPCDLELSKI